MYASALKAPVNGILQSCLLEVKSWKSINISLERNYMQSARTNRNPNEGLGRVDYFDPDFRRESIMADQIDQRAIKELLPFLSLDAREDVKALALDYILGLSGSDSGKNFLKENDEYLRRLLDLTKDSNSRICGVAFSVLVNLSAEILISEKLLEYNFIEPFLNYALNPSSEHAGKAAMILSNITRTERGCNEVLKVTKSSVDCSLYKIVEVLCKENYNAHCKLHYLATFLSNLTQLQESRDFILDKDRCVIQRLLPFTTYNASLTKRGGIVGTLKNCCFETGELYLLTYQSIHQ